MIVIVKDDISKDEYKNITDYIIKRGARIHESKGKEKSIIGIIGDKRDLDKNAMEALPGVDKVVPILEPYKLASRKFNPKSSIIKVGDVKIGGPDPVIMAGPCSVESEEQIWDIAREVSEQGGHILRGGVFKPRTSPYSFQGMGLEGAKLISAAGKNYNLPVITEVMEIQDIETLYDYVDIFQIGARNMQHFKLLKAIGKTDKPVFLKRGMSATLNEFLMSAEYILSEGNQKVMLCERGIRTFVEYSRFTFDLNVVPMIKNISQLPIIVDASHATGRRDLIPPVTLAGLTAGADGFMVEIHPKPHEAFSDGNQSLNYKQFKELMDKWEIMKDSVLKLRNANLEEIENNVHH